MKEKRDDSGFRCDSIGACCVYLLSFQIKADDARSILHRWLLRHKLWAWDLITGITVLSLCCGMYVNTRSYMDGGRFQVPTTVSLTP